MLRPPLFLRNLAGITGLVAPGSRAVAGRSVGPPGDSNQRSQVALKIRQKAALFQCNQPAASSVRNGYEPIFPPSSRTSPKVCPTPSSEKSNGRGYFGTMPNWLRFSHFAGKRGAKPRKKAGYVNIPGFSCRS